MPTPGRGGILEMIPQIQEVTPTLFVWRDTLFRVTLSFTHIPPGASMTVLIICISDNMSAILITTFMAFNK